MLQYPPPWTLRGRGVVLCHRVARDWRQRNAPGTSGPLVVTMWVDYKDTPVGPYREWLMVPGRVPNPRGRHYSISDIYVDSDKSLIGGRQNWGIPKELATFQFQARDRRVETSLLAGDTRLELTGQTAGPAFPVSNAWLAPALYQEREGQGFWTKPCVRGRCRWLRLDGMDQHGDAFPDVTGEKILAALFVERFEMTFPCAETVTLNVA